MWSEVILPLWLVIVLAIGTGWWLLDRFFIPSVRWALRRRANRAINELNTHLKLDIQPFKLTKRKVMVDRLLYDPDVLSAAKQHALEENIPQDVAMQKAEHYAREIVPTFSAYAYFRFGTRIARRISKSLYRVRVGFSNDEALKTVPSDASVIFVINHRSNMDYVLVTYVAASSSALSYAVGEWAQVWGLRGLIRSMGAYFIRRNSRNALYRKVLSKYVAMATKAGVVQAIFPEGGLTRDGSLRAPKFGLLSYMISDFDPTGPRDAVFIPVGLNYDRVLEDRVLVDAAATPTGEAPRFRFNPLIFSKFIAKNIWLVLRGHWHRNGYTCVSFGKPVSLRTYLSKRNTDLRTLSADARAAEIEKIGLELMEAVGNAVPALPVPLVATALLDAGAPITMFELKGRVFSLIGSLERLGAYVCIPRRDYDYAIDVGLRMLKMRRMIFEKEGTYQINPEEIPLLRFYANSISHLVQRAPSPPMHPRPPIELSNV